MRRDLMRRDLIRRDNGNISVLTLGWVVIALIALLVMAAATQVHVDRMRLGSLADEAALAAADELDIGGYYPTSGREVRLSQARMSSAVTQWLSQDPRPWASDVVVLEVKGSADGTATVRLGRTVYPLFNVEALGPFSTGIALEVEGNGRGG